MHWSIAISLFQDLPVCALMRKISNEVNSYYIKGVSRITPTELGQSWRVEVLRWEYKVFTRNILAACVLVCIGARLRAAQKFYAAFLKKIFFLFRFHRRQSMWKTEMTVDWDTWRRDQSKYCILVEYISKKFIWFIFAIDQQEINSIIFSHPHTIMNNYISDDLLSNTKENNCFCFN